MRQFLLFVLASLFFLPLARTQEVREYMDLQLHPTMHVPYFFFKNGLQYFPPGKEPRLTFKHQFKNVIYGNYLEGNAGARIWVTGALTREGMWSKAKARRVILKQLDQINQFAADHADRFAVARSPADVRNLLRTTDKTIIIHSIEGAKKLIHSQADADFWAEQGIAFITLIHLVDSDLGSSAIKPGFFFRLINLKGALRSKKKRGGLSEKGKKAIGWLANAGIMTDITHMSDSARADALDYMEAHQLPPIATHDVFRPIQNHPRGITPQQIIRIYRNGGFISLPVSGYSLAPYRPAEPYRSQLDSLEKNNCYCDRSIDTYKFTYLAVKHLLESEAATITADTTRPFATWSDSEKVKLAIGFQSDFNGWLNHSRPRYGRKGCYPIAPDSSYAAIETQGMPHPGLLPSQWTLLEQEGVDLQPIRRSAERFLQLWEQYRMASKNKP